MPGISRSSFLLRDPSDLICNRPDATESQADWDLSSLGYIKEGVRNGSGLGFPVTMVFPQSKSSPQAFGAFTEVSIDE